MEIELNEKEVELINNMVFHYWEDFNSSHEDNKNDWLTTLSFFRKIHNKPLI